MNKRGFLLLEFLLFCPILLLSLAVFTLSFSASKSLFHSSEKNMRSLYALRSEMENIKRLGFCELPAQDGRTFAGGSGRIFVRPLSPDLVEVEVTLAGKSLYTLRSSQP